MTQTLSLKMSQHLSSLVPGFEGHWYWCGRYDNEDKFVDQPFIQCESSSYIEGPREWDATVTRIICPAWQVEDLLRNIWALVDSQKDSVRVLVTKEIIRDISCFLADNNPDTAYQKIEEYLWTILK